MHLSPELVALARQQSGLLHVEQLTSHGVTRGQLRGRLGDQWRMVLPRVVSTAPGPLGVDRPPGRGAALRRRGSHDQRIGCGTLARGDVGRTGLGHDRGARTRAAPAAAALSNPTDHPSRWPRLVPPTGGPRLAAAGRRHGGAGVPHRTGRDRRRPRSGPATTRATRRPAHGARMRAEGGQRPVAARDRGRRTGSLVRPRGGSRRADQAQPGAAAGMAQSSSWSPPTACACRGRTRGSTSVALAVQVHSHRYHSDPDDWEATVMTDGLLVECGMVVIGVTPRAIARRPRGCSRRIERAYEQAASRPWPAVRAVPIASIA